MILDENPHNTANPIRTLQIIFQKKNTIVLAFQLQPISMQSNEIRITANQCAFLLDSRLKMCLICCFRQSNFFTTDNIDTTTAQFKSHNLWDMCIHIVAERTAHAPCSTSAIMS